MLMNNEIIINNIDPQNIVIEEGTGAVVGITKVYVNGVDVTDGDKAYIIVPTKLSELSNDVGYLTSETDPTVPSYVKEISIADINSWNNKQNLLVSGTNIKTINGQTLLGSGNITISGGTTIDVQINGTSIVENDIANILTNSPYDSINPLATMEDVPEAISDLINDTDFASTNNMNTFTQTQTFDKIIANSIELIDDSNINQFKETEILCGKWIDGSDLYRKTFQTTLADTDTVTINTLLSSEVIVNIFGSCNNGIKVLPINYYNSTTHDRIETYYDSGDIYITSNFDASGYTGFITLEYIKE